MFAGLPPSSSDLVERKSVVPPSPPADRRREHRGRGSRLEAAYFVALADEKSVSARSSSARRRAIRDFVSHL
jgi:hypothetical protein